MSTKENLVYKINYELTQINKECEFLNILIKKSINSGLDPIELRASSASLQSVYNGFEKILIQVFKEYKYSIPKSHAWHSELLNKSVEKKIISSSLEKSLRDYMGFRHFIRHAYSFMLDFELIQPLLLNLDNTRNSFSTEIIDHIEKN